MRTIKDFIDTYLPTHAANLATAGGKSIKKHMRMVARMQRYGKKAVIKNVAIADARFAIELQPYKNGCVDEYIADHSVWEPMLSKEILKHVHPGDTFVDIGANIGYYSLLVAARLSGKGSIHSFEPVPRIARQLKRSIALNGYTNITLHTIALGDKVEEKLLNVRDENMGGSSIGSYDDLSVVATSGVEQVVTHRLDDVLKDEARIDVIKIDIEGYEFEALQGAREILSKHHPILFMEFSPIFYEHARPGKSLELIAYLENFGYGFFTISDQPLNLRAWVIEHAHDTSPQIDILCRV